MQFIYGLSVCSPICPPLSTNELVSPSDDDLHRQLHSSIDSRLSKNSMDIFQNLIFSPSIRNENMNENDIDDEFDQISLTDNIFVSFQK